MRGISGDAYRQKVREHLDNVDLRTKASEDRGKLNADRAGAKHDHRFRYVIEIEDMVACDNAFAIDIEFWKGFRHRARSNDDIFGLESLLFALAALYLYLALSGQSTESFVSINFVFLDQKLNAFGVFRDDTVLALDGLGVIQGWRL